MKDNHVVIMAGGIGSRFWPMSTTERPKQFIDVLGCGKTLIQLTAERFAEICPKENIWVVTNKNYADMVAEGNSNINIINLNQGEECINNMQNFYSSELRTTAHKHVPV